MTLVTLDTLEAARAGESSRLIRRARRPLAVLGAAFALAFAQAAQAQSAPPLDNAGAADAMHTYFNGEKAAAPFIFMPGLTGMGAGLVMAVQGGEVTRGAGYPMIGLGLIQTVVGSALLLGTDKRVTRLDADLAKDPAAWKRDETKRMGGVKTTLIALMVIESVLIAGGTATAVVTSQKECCRTLRGVSIGLAAESAATLLFDIFAYRRASDYADSLGRFEPSSGASPSKEGAGASPMSFRPISFSGRF